MRLCSHRNLPHGGLVGSRLLLAPLPEANGSRPLLMIENLVPCGTKKGLEDFCYNTVPYDPTSGTHKGVEPPVYTPLGSSVWIIRPDWQKSLVQPVDANIVCFLRILSSSRFSRAPSSFGFDEELVEGLMACLDEVGWLLVTWVGLSELWKEWSA